MKNQYKTGFTLIEVMMSLVILAMLMTAVAFAFDAAVTNYQQNQGIYETVNRARQALLRITNDLRTANGVATETDDSPNQDSQISLVTATNQNITYRFDDTDNKLYYDENSTASSYTLCENVTAMTFNRAPVPGDPNAIRSVRIVMTLTDDSSEVAYTLPAATLIRKNQ